MLGSWETPLVAGVRTRDLLTVRPSAAKPNGRAGDFSPTRPDDHRRGGGTHTIKSLRKLKMGLPNPGMAIEADRTALVITDLQNDFLTPGGNGWSLFADS
jgi:hypothetical protein